MKIAGVVLLRLAIMVGLVVTFFGAAALVIPACQREADSRSGLRTDTAPEWWLIGAVLREPTDIAPGHWLMGLHIRRSGLRAPLHFCHFWNRKQAEALFAKLRTQLWRPKLRIAKWRFSGCSFGESRSDS